MTSASTHALQDSRIASTLVAHASPFDVPALARTNKSLSAPATRALYTTLAFTDAAVAYLALQTVAHAPHLALHVRVLQLYRDRQRARAPLPPAFWQALQRALAALPALESLVLTDMSGAPAPTPAVREYAAALPLQAPFRLRDARLFLPWSAHLAAFLAHQPALRTLQLESFAAAPAPPGTRINDHLPPDQPALPHLQVFDGPLRVALDLARCPLTHLQLYADGGDPAPLLPVLAGLRRTLRALNLPDVPEARTADLLRALVPACPQLLHLGALALPPGNRMPCYASLQAFARLRSLELELAAWNPPPPLSLQRALVAEVNTYCAALDVVVIWLNHIRIVWTLNPASGNWEGRPEVQGTRGGWKSV